MTIGEDIVQFIGPHFHDVDGMLDGMKEFERATRGREALTRAAAIAFRLRLFAPDERRQRKDPPLPDQRHPPSGWGGSGWCHSSRVGKHHEHAGFGHGYDQTLEVFSCSFMRRYATSYRFEEFVTYDDGVRSNLVFDEYQDANNAWRYLT